MSIFQPIATSRLILRNFQESDADAVFEIFSDSRVIEFYDIDAFTDMDQAVQNVAENIQRNATPDRRGTRWAICLADCPEKMIGSCGFHAAHKEFKSIEIGYELHPNYWGKGYAFEAVSQMLNFCFEDRMPFRVNRVSARTNLDSQRSIALLQKLGFKEEGVLRQSGFWKNQFHDVRIFSFLREEWEASVKSL